jgi:uncharacterized protein (DUF427 family)
MDSEDPAPESAWAKRPDYRVELLTRTNTMTARLGDTQLAHSDKCLVVDVQDHGLVIYFPLESVDFSQLEPVSLHTVCPFKGQASYWRALASDRPWVAWRYPSPFPEVAKLVDYLAFDQDAVNVTIGTGYYTGLRP